MRILVVGAGAIGGYFGGRLLQAGRDITFLVRPRRASELSSAGLVIKSPNGDVTLKNPPTVQADAIKDKFDVVLLSCKAYDLEDAVKSFAPAVGPQTSIIPLLNGMLHLDVLDKRFGRERVLGGLRAIGEVFSAIEGASASGHVMQDMWEKWVFLASIAAATCLMRAPVGMILAAPGGKDFMLGILDECKAVATAEGFPPRAPALQRAQTMLTTEGSPLTASMFRDIKANMPVEADHVVGDLIARGDAAKVPVPRLRTAYTHLKAYEKQRG